MALMSKSVWDIEIWRKIYRTWAVHKFVKKLSLAILRWSSSASHFKDYYKLDMLLNLLYSDVAHLAALRWILSSLLICDYIWENPTFTHNYKYLEILILIIWSIITQKGKWILAWKSSRFYGYLLSIYPPTIGWITS